MYLMQLLDIKEILQSSTLITLYSADAVPIKKRPRCALNKIICYIMLYVFVIKTAGSTGRLVRGVHCG